MTTYLQTAAPFVLCLNHFSFSLRFLQSNEGNSRKDERLKKVVNVYIYIYIHCRYDKKNDNNDDYNIYYIYTYTGG